MASKIFTTKISSRGQVVIPKELRKDLQEGTPLVVKRREDSIILKKVNLDVDWEKIERDFEETRRIVRKSFRKSGLTGRDLPKIIERLEKKFGRSSRKKFEQVAHANY